MRDVLVPLMNNRYAPTKQRYPDEGRRRWQLRVLQEFWNSNPAPPLPSSINVEDESVTNLSKRDDDDDPLDELLTDVMGGVLIRTDYSDENAWQVFSTKLKEAEAELSGSPSEAQPETDGGASASQDVDMDNDADEGEDGDDSDDDEAEGKLIKVINPEIPEEQAIFQNISNLRALRLFNDVDIRPAPVVPSGSKRISPQNRLVDQAGWQEIYTGATVWIYDKQSNTNCSVKLVSGEGDIYGTATGDSWRAQVSHVYDLQFNMSFSGMKITFGGADRWDYSERKRNMEEADKL
ncbi:hypothetical protein K435DRAFT_452947 [Dendrothele bispora CBS 962.96]|uniref:Uncharacterized protein n=1 Tax=Dendrothele bispora (strain CBS 962.96) TaxID=1314807 RepID=A0A4S8MUG6_DENBC|nr:hypothetical protein K435DRAFT_452947 [Dendrothele bispora CBS 962.96]